MSRILVITFCIAFPLLPACSSQGPCGPEMAPSTAALATVDGTSYEFGNFISSPNNDCPNAGSPTSLTIEGTQTGEMFYMTFCLSKPEEVESGEPIPITFTDPTKTEEPGQLININIKDGDCTTAVDFTGTVSGTMTVTGYCDDGSHPDGYALTLDASVSATKTCMMTTTPTTISLSGTVAVAALNP